MERVGAREARWWVQAQRAVIHAEAGPYGWRERLFRARWEERLTEARLVAVARTRALHSLGVGQEQGVWGVFSAGDGFTLESTLERLQRDTDVPRTVREEAEQIAADLPEMRAAAALTDDPTEHIIEEHLVRWITTAHLPSELRDNLRDHLPGHIRPLPDSLEELLVGRLRISLYITAHRTPDRRVTGLEIVDIHASHAIRQGQGFGTAALVELCRFADAHRLPITAQFVPDRGDEMPTNRIRTAHWYHRHGFQQGDQTAEEWAMRKTITRPALVPERS